MIWKKIRRNWRCRHQNPVFKKKEGISENITQAANGTVENKRTNEGMIINNEKEQDEHNEEDISRTKCDTLVNENK